MKQIMIMLVVLLAGVSAQAQGYHTESNASGSKSSNTSFGKNILSFSPVQLIVTNANQDVPDVGVSLAYERIFNNKMMSFKLPVSFSLNNHYTYIMPMLKLYPAKQGVVKYAVGPQLLIGMGDGTYHSYSQDSNGVSHFQTNTIKRHQLGFLVNNSINFTLAKAFYIGLDASLGIIYVDNMPRDTFYYTGVMPTTNNAISPAFQMNFCMGYRF